MAADCRSSATCGFISRRQVPHQSLAGPQGQGSQSFPKASTTRFQPFLSQGTWTLSHAMPPS